MPEADFRATMLRLRDDARLRIDMLHQLVSSIEAIYALPPMLSKPANGELQSVAPKPKPASPPRPPSPAPQKTNGAGQGAKGRAPNGSTRSRILTALKGKSEPVQPKTLAAELGMSPQLVGYHITVLTNSGLVTATGTTNDRRVAAA